MVFKDKRFSNFPSNSVGPLMDGRVHIHFALPITKPRTQLWLTLMLGYRRGNELLISHGKIVGVNVWPQDWVGVLAALHASPITILEFLLAAKTATEA